MAISRSIAKLVDDYQFGFSLEREFYKRDDVYEKEVEDIFLKHWLLAGHVSQIPGAGDFFLFEFDNESFIVTRNRQNEIKAHLNVCRHRGSRLCLQKTGSVNAFTCPYHAWSYNLDGELINARIMDADFDKSTVRLHQAHVALVGGLIFVSLAENPLSLTPMFDDLQSAFDLFGFDNMKLVRQNTYRINANWKLAVENYQECYHCTPSHREYAKIHALALTPEKFEARRLQYLAQKKNSIPDTSSSYYFDLSRPGEEGYQYARHPLLENMKSGTLDGQPASSLLGEITEYDGGASEFMLGPVSFFLIYNDHMVAYRFLPLTVDTCVCDVFWLVRGDAEEGKDYDLQELIWLWDVTTQADETIISNNKKGVDSRFYRPGKLSEMESFQQHFLNWYLASLK